MTNIGVGPHGEALDDLLSEVSSDQLMTHVHTIAQWVRLSGTDEEGQAFDYIERTLQDFGLQTQRFNPVCLVSLPGAASLTIANSGEELPCITHSFSAATGSTGIAGELVYAGSGSPADYQTVDVAGKIVLLDGLAMPTTVEPAERHGAIGVIHISGPHLHEMIISPVWGSPTPDTESKLPTIPHISIDDKTGDRLRALLAEGLVTVRMTTEVETGWSPLPVVVASIEPAEPPGEFVLFSGHVDSWHYGAMDNGSANALMLEVARILARHRPGLKREVRLAFWSGHSHARYATSTWFADEFWHELHESCVAHVNIDSPGAINATVLSAAATMAETHDLAQELIRDLAGQELTYNRIGRMGDQSLWGVGVPSLYCSISEQGASQEASDLTELLGGTKARSGGLGWWWHTTEDTVDKIDPANLVRDTKILLATIYVVSTEPVLPFNQARAVEEIVRALDEIADASGSAFDLSAVQADAEALRESAAQLRRRCSQPASATEARILNECQMRVSRLLIPINYTKAGPFEHDLALPVKPLPGLRPAAQLSGMAADDPERYPLETTLRRERNRVRHALREACRSIDRALEGVS